MELSENIKILHDILDTEGIQDLKTRNDLERVYLFRSTAYKDTSPIKIVKEWIIDHEYGDKKYPLGWLRELLYIKSGARYKWNFYVRDVTAWVEIKYLMLKRKRKSERTKSSNK